VHDVEESGAETGVETGILGAGVDTTGVEATTAAVVEGVETLMRPVVD